jgi:hypothetical protein
MIPLATWDIRSRQRHEIGRITPHALVGSVQYALSGLSATRRMVTFEPSFDLDVSAYTM